MAIAVLERRDDANALHAADDVIAFLDVAKLLARGGSMPEALRRIDLTVGLAETTDGLNQRAATKLAYGEVLRMADRERDAERAIATAIALFEEKGNVVAARDARDRLGVELTT